MKIDDRTYLLRQNEALFSATLDEFSSKSYELASTNEIIKNSDYNKGSFYYRFKTKDDIYFALIDYVYVTQVSLFNNQNIKINNLMNLEDIIRIMFAQLKQLYIIDSRYIDLLNMIYKESKEFNNYIRQNCVESQLERFLMRLEIILRKSYSQFETETFLDLITFSYHNVNIDFDNNFDEYVNNIISFLLEGHNKPTNVLSKVKFDLKDIEDNFMIILAKYGALAPELNDDIIRISNLLKQQNDYIKEIRENFKIQKVSIESLINIGLNNDQSKFDNLVSLLSLDYAQISFHNLTNIQKIVLLSIYNILIGKAMIVIDYQIKFIYYNDTKLLLKDILPILSQNCKIVVLEEEINLIPAIYKNIYYIDSFSNIKKLVDSDVVVDFEKDIVVEYYDESDNLKTEYFARKDPIILKYLKDNKVVNINTYTKLSIDELI